MRSGVAIPVNGVEKSRVVGVDDGVVAAVVADVENPEGFSRSEHRNRDISGMPVECGCGSMEL